MSWLLLPPVTDPAGGGRPVPPAVTAAPEDDDGSATDLVLPVAAAATAAGLAAYSLVRRRRRATLHTTPTGMFEPPVAPLPGLRHRARLLLVETDDCVRTSAEELRFAAARSGHDASRPFAEALADARGGLAAAFRAGQRLDDETGTVSAGIVSDGEERALLEEILTRCTAAQRRLDAAAPAFDQLRALEREITPALECAEARFRELTGRTATAATTLAALREGYAPTASLAVTGHVEQAKDRLVFATTELNRARQTTDLGGPDIGAVHLRAAEGAIDQADVFVTGVERLAVQLARATETSKRGSPFTGPYDDPLDVLRRQGRPLLPARSAVADAADFVTTHRGAVGARARTRLTEAERHLAQAEADAADTGTGAGAGAGAGTSTGAAGAEDSPHAQRAHALAREARRLAEQDVRAYGNPYGGPVGDGLAGALLGGIILGEAPGGGGRGDLRGPACYGGTATRGRRAVGGQF